MISPVSQLLICLSVLLLLVIGVLFFGRQNQAAKMGGQIAKAKMLWLLYVVCLWFFLCPILAFEEQVLASVRLLLGGISVLMWCRGIVELVMMYVFKNWRPPYGIAHDVFCCLCLVMGLSYYGPSWTLLSLVDMWMVALLFVVLFTLFLETFYAVVFFRIVGEHTTGDDGVWFASTENAQFRRIVRITALWNVPLYLFLLGFLCIPVLGVI